ncbi:MAG: hypothetical protein BHW64_05805 [Candidatus Melainabacteria bacterium LEY3_CP_29_8]|nr:MAG: hypothetical protein BHW64_05805 [Candidatus Melainabacteria bacterium LEY3_CP_29_8]
MELVVLKRMVIISSILGGILGVVTVIPIINVLSFFAILFLSAPIVIMYMTKYNMMGVLDLKQSLIYGAIIGFISFLGFSITFVPLATIIGLIYKSSFYLGVSMLFREGFFVMLLMVFFVALLGGALMNSFSSLLYYQIRTYLFNDEINDNILNENIDYEIGE